MFYDTALYHTRLDSLVGNKGRRSMHQYYARGGYVQHPADPGSKVEFFRHAWAREPAPLLTNWVWLRGDVGGLCV